MGALGNGTGRRSCNDDIGIAISVDLIKTVGFLLWHLARMAREDASDARDIHQWQWRGDRRIALVVAAVRMQIRCQQGESEGTMAWRQTGRGRLGEGAC